MNQNIINIFYSFFICNQTRDEETKNEKSANGIEKKKTKQNKQTHKQTLDSLFIVEASSSSELMTMVPMSLSTSVASSLLIIIVSWLCTLEAVFINMVLSSPTFTIVPESTASSPSSSSSSSWIQKTKGTYWREWTDSSPPT